MTSRTLGGSVGRMERITGVRPSPALIVAVLALVAGLAGTAVAGQGSGVTKKKVKKIATKQINKLAPGLSVANADTATDATNAVNADRADNATNASNALNATNAANAGKVDGADVCSGVVSLQNNDVRDVCVAGPLRVEASCGINPTFTTVSLEVASDQDNAWAFGRATDGSTSTEIGAPRLDTASEDLTSAIDSNASPGVATGGGSWISAGHPDGSSINGQFSVRANHTGTSQGTCVVSMGATTR